MGSNLWISIWQVAAGVFRGFHGPVLAAMLLEEMGRAELHDPDTMPPGHARLNSRVTATTGA